MTKDISDKEYTQRLYQKLTEGNVEASLQIYEKYIKISAADFVDNILKPTLTKIGDDCENKKNQYCREPCGKKCCCSTC